MTEIAASSNGHCLDRAISTMRLALGYEKGLPDCWPDGKKLTSGFLEWLPSAFPDREIVVWHAPDGDYEGIEHGRIIYAGSHIAPASRWDKYLVAFMYTDYDESCGGSHAVIGWPTQYSGYPCIGFVFAVRI